VIVFVFGRSLKLLMRVNLHPRLLSHKPFKWWLPPGIPFHPIPSSSAGSSLRRKERRRRRRRRWRRPYYNNASEDWQRERGKSTVDAAIYLAVDAAIETSKEKSDEELIHQIINGGRDPEEEAVA